MNQMNQSTIDTIAALRELDPTLILCDAPTTVEGLATYLCDANAEEAASGYDAAPTDVDWLAVAEALMQEGK